MDLEALPSMPVFTVESAAPHRPLEIRSTSASCFGGRVETKGLGHEVPKLRAADKTS